MDYRPTYSKERARELVKQNPIKLLKKRIARYKAHREKIKRENKESAQKKQDQLGPFL